MVRGVLSNEGRNVTSREAAQWLMGHLNLDEGDVKVDMVAESRRSFVRDVELLTAKPPSVEAFVTPERYRKTVEIPASYYLERGYREETLRTFEVGLCIREASPEFGRVVYPVYDRWGKQIIGVVSRSTLPTCPSCKLCHRGDCPDDENRLPHLRWKVVGRFTDKHHLYNLWRAAPDIAHTKVVVVVEGAGDVWRLHEAGVRNVVGLFGSDLHDMQEILLQECGARHLIALTDMDEAGEKAAEALRRRCGTFMNVHRLRFEGKDVGELSVDEVKRQLKPFVESKCQRSQSN